MSLALAVLNMVNDAIHSLTHPFTYPWKEWTTDNSGSLRGPTEVSWAPKPKGFVWLCGTNHAISLPEF